VFSDKHSSSRSIVSGSIVSTVLATLAVAAIALTGAAAHAQRASSGERIEINVGDQETVSAANVQSYSVGVENIADVRLTADGRTFVIVGQHAGETSLLLIYADGHQVRYTIVVRDHTTVARTGEVVARDNIRLDLYFVQLSQTYDHNIGIGWPGTIGGNATVNLTLDFTPPTGPAFQQATASLLQQALPRLDLAQTAGWARLIRQGMLVTANGEQASIDTGGEINFLVTTGFAAEIRRIQFGTVIRMQPQYDPDTRRIEITIGADVSELTSAGTAGVPGRLRTQLQTIVNMELGQSIVIGGLVSRSTSETQGGLPGLSQIPILGVLFGTNIRREEAVENFLFVVPTVVQSVPRSQADRITEALHVYESFGSIGGHGLGDIELIEPSPPGFE
jgi:pilus assembly protein CpaC